MIHIVRIAYRYKRPPRGAKSHLSQMAIILMLASGSSQAGEDWYRFNAGIKQHPCMRWHSPADDIREIRRTTGQDPDVIDTKDAATGQVVATTISFRANNGLSFTYLLFRGLERCVEYAHKDEDLSRYR